MICRVANGSWLFAVWRSRNSRGQISFGYFSSWNGRTWCCGERDDRTAAVAIRGADFGSGCSFRARFVLPRNRRRHGAYRHFGTWDRAGLRNDIERNQILGGVRNFRRGVIPNGAAPNFRRRVCNGQLELRFLWLIAGPLYDVRQLRHDLRRGARRIRPYQSLSRMRYAHGNRKDGLPRASSVRTRTFGNAGGNIFCFSRGAGTAAGNEIRGRSGCLAGPC